MPFVAGSLQKVARAVTRARVSILTVAGAYAVSLLAGIAMVHCGSSFALNYGDALVRDASQKDPAAIANSHDDNLKAALYDFAGNLGMGSVPKAIMGMAIVLPYPLVVYQGWIGGIVSVRGDHTSRLNTFRSAVYYLLTIILQITAYSLTIGAGVNVGISLFRPAPDYRGEKWGWIFPKEAVRDLFRIYALATPIFLLASFWEFFSTWNI